MLFTRTHEFDFSIPKEYLKFRLVGNKLKIHDLGFDIIEEDNSLSVMPHQDDANFKTLPVTEIKLKEGGNKTHVIITCKMRYADSGGPIVIILFCLFLFFGSFILLYVSKDPALAVALCCFSLCVLTFFMIRMQISYFDYIRKIRTYIQFSGDEITLDVRRQLFKHKSK